MAALSTLVLTLARSGKTIAAQRELHGGSAQLLQGIVENAGSKMRWFDHAEITRLTPGDLESCKLLWVESPNNPTLRLIDLRRTGEVARRAGTISVVDSTFATPILQRPLEHGFDLVVHSASKYLGGHSDLMGGAIAGSTELLTAIAKQRRQLGGTLDPFPAFLLHRGMRTLSVRMLAHCDRAAQVAGWLANCPDVATVVYPGLEQHPDHELAQRQMNAAGGMVSFVVKGGVQRAIEVHDQLQRFVRAGTLGGTESLVSMPARMSHRGLDARPGQTQSAHTPL